MAVPATPQWQFIERVTSGEIFAATGKRAGAEELLNAAIVSAGQRRLPRQLQRAVRTANRSGLNAVAQVGQAALERLRVSLAPTM